MSNITNLNRDYLIKINVKEATIDVPKMTFWNTDKKTSNMFVQLVINMSTNELISNYVTVQNATDYKITLNVIKPKTNQYKTIEATLLNEEKALFEIDLPDEFTDQVGNYNFEFEVSSKVDSNDESITTSSSSYTVNGSILTNLNEETSSSPDLPILKQLIEQVKSLQGGDLTGYQKKSDNSLETTSKEVVGAINEVNSQFKEIAKQIEQGGTGGNINMSGFTAYTLFESPTIADTWACKKGPRILEMTSDEFLSTFYDAYIGTNSDGYTVTKTALGKDETQTYTIHEYDFKPKNWNRMILLSGGMHPYELSACFGLAHFMKFLMNNHDSHEGLKYIYENVRIKVVPIINVWGWNQNPKTYGNVNGVNINRNFDANGNWDKLPVVTPSQNEWNVKGDAPFSENETKVMNNWLSNNTGAEFYIDTHTGLNAFGNADNCLYYLPNSTLKNKIETALGKLNNWIKDKYGTLGTSNSDKMWTGTPNCITDYAETSALEIPAFTIEQNPENRKWGTSTNNEGSDIMHYVTTISTYIMELLLKETENINLKNLIIKLKQQEIEANKKLENEKELETNNSYYSITNKLTNCITNNNSTSIMKESPYNAIITPDDGYILNSITVTMGGTDITSTVVNENSINIAKVTGNIIITAIARLKSKDNKNIFNVDLTTVRNGDTSIIDTTNNKTLDIIGSDWTKNDDGGLVFGTNSYIKYNDGLYDKHKEFTLVLDMLLDSTVNNNVTRYIVYYGDFNSSNDGFVIKLHGKFLQLQDFSNSLINIQWDKTNIDSRQKYIITSSDGNIVLRTKNDILATGTIDLKVPSLLQTTFGNIDQFNRNTNTKFYGISLYNYALSNEEIQSL
jgi:hypothetical protein